MMTDDNKIVVGFYGAPNAGKTVAASSLFAALKRRHLDSVLVSEAAKDFVVEGNTTALANQLFVWSTQQFRIFAAYRHAQIVVTDSPILLGAVYNEASPALVSVILEEYHRYNNLNIFIPLDADRPHSMVGRVHTREESEVINGRILDLLTECAIPFLNYPDFREDEIVDLIEDALR